MTISIALMLVQSVVSGKIKSHLLKNKSRSLAS